MAALTEMKGSLTSNNGAVSMGAGGILEGRLLSTAGAASVYDVDITIPVCEISALSANLLTFTGACDKQNVVLNWSTSFEVNNDYFTVERSLDMDFWQHVGIVFGSEYSSQLLSYSFID